MALNKLPPNINSMPWVDTSNKELDTIMDTRDTHNTRNSLEVQSKVDLDTLNKLWDRIRATVLLITMNKAIKVTRITPHPVGTKTRMVAEAVDTVDEMLTTTTNTKTNTTLNSSTLHMAHNLTEWATMDTSREV